MTQIQLDNLDESELEMLFYIVNVISPTTCPNIEFDLRTIKWYRHDMLIQNIANCFPKLKHEGHAVFSSLLSKLGSPIEIRYEQPPIQTEKSEITASI